jgi:D-alanyl-D-alanine carboxypeptidase/D-alanyl-D-alanine-endopeptidase (penicillin-binding protein 4)
MKKTFLSFTVLLSVSGLFAQTITTKLAEAFTDFEKDSQLKSSIVSLYVIDAINGNVLFDKNSHIGLAPASTQKIITAAAAYELLGASFQYKTEFGYYGSLKKNRLNGGIYIKPSGDPTLGSWRWKSASEDSVLLRVSNAIKKTGIKKFNSFMIDATGWESETIPGGWIWEDIGNYYGAGAEILNWRENQYDLIMKSGADIGETVIIKGTKPNLYNYNFVSAVTSAAKGTGDNSYIYFPLTSTTAIVRGTIPVNEEKFTISGAMPSGRNQFLNTLNDSLLRKGIQKELMNLVADKFSKSTTPATINLFHTEVSPTLDSMIFWFLKRSINLYGEALAKTMAAKNGKTASTYNGANLISKHWSEKGIGIDPTELNMKDGSGLSPLNRVTTHAQVAILQYAKKQPWFDGYFNAFPEFNGMKVKSGTINDVKGFCGYHTSKEGNQFIFSFLVNNYNGSSSALVKKMYKLMDVLK